LAFQFRLALCFFAGQTFRLGATLRLFLRPARVFGFALGGFARQAFLFDASFGLQAFALDLLAHVLRPAFGFLARAFPAGFFQRDVGVGCRVGVGVGRCGRFLRGRRSLWLLFRCRLGFQDGFSLCRGVWFRDGFRLCLRFNVRRHFRFWLRRIFIRCLIFPHLLRIARRPKFNLYRRLRRFGAQLPDEQCQPQREVQRQRIRQAAALRAAFRVDGAGRVQRHGQGVALGLPSVG